MTLPKGWAETTIGEVFSINPKHPAQTDRSQTISFVPMPAVDEHLGSIVSATDRKLSEIWTGYTHFGDGDVIFAKITPCMENGKAAIARGLTNGMACGSTEFYVFRPAEGISADYLWRFLRQQSFRDEAERHMSGAVGQRRVPRDYLEQHHLPLPPEAEQRRIVAKLDALTARLARARAELDRVPVLAKRLRESSVTAAFSGWARHPLGEVSRDIRYGYTASAQPSGPGSKFLRITDIHNRTVDWSTVPYVRPSPREIARCGLKTGDIVFARSGATVGKSLLLVEPPVDAVFASYLIRVRVNEDVIDPKVAAYYFQSSEYWAQIKDGATGTGQPNFNGSKLAELLVPVGTRGQQQQAIRSVERAFARADRLEAEATRARALLDRLESAILARAFRGELVPQDPNDEPAEALLARIRTDRAAAPKAKRGKKAKT